ncbi:alpha/beta fold hydrolase [Amnibacterium flavum]|uniref:alpha/beta fold hydrolase n=1 Tax=Amnibacterium flavum TaxID=2173173 RepID=UPI001402573A|nr:alpha/beta fold hydrolase [Amnibacterium flavum]
MVELSETGFRIESVGASLTVAASGVVDPVRPSVLFLPALGVPLGYYGPLFEAWAGRGRAVFGAETRGMPLSPVHNRASATGYAALVGHDVPALVGAVGERSPGGVMVVGHSLGGQVALLAAAAGRIDVDAVVAVASGTSAVESVPTLPGRLRRRFEIAVVRSTISTLGYWPGHRLGFGGRQSRDLMADWAYEARRGGYRLAGDATDYEAALGRLEVPTLLVGIEGDELITPRALRHLADRLPPSVDTVEVPESPDRQHGHFAWARRDPEAVITPIEEWLARHESRNSEG